MGSDFNQINLGTDPYSDNLASHLGPETSSTMFIRVRIVKRTFQTSTPCYFGKKNGAKNFANQMRIRFELRKFCCFEFERICADDRPKKHIVTV